MQSKLFKGIIALAILVCVVILLQLCSSEPDIKPIEDIGPLKEVIKEQKLEKDSIHDKAVAAVNTVTVYVTKWRTLKGMVDSMPCPDALAEVIVLTDSIVATDSTAISELKAELFVSNLIIANQDTLIKKDSAVIAQKDKEIRKQKRWKNFWKGTTIVAAGLNLAH